jgi:transcriptional regulator with XRE-family HTH domain
VTLLAEVWKSDQEIIGENIKKARKAAKLTQEQLAEEMGGSCSNKVISRYEKGEVEMGVQTLIDIAENLEVPVDSLMPERVQVHTEPEDDEMNRLFSGLNTENREMLLKMARMMAQNETLKMAI